MEGRSKLCSLNIWFVHCVSSHYVQLSPAKAWRDNWNKQSTYHSDVHRNELRCPRNMFRTFSESTNAKFHIYRRLKCQRDKQGKKERERMEEREKEGESSREGEREGRKARRWRAKKEKGTGRKRKEREKRCSNKISWIPAWEGVIEFTSRMIFIDERRICICWGLNRVQWIHVKSENDHESQPWKFFYSPKF